MGGGGGGSKFKFSKRVLHISKFTKFETRFAVTEFPNLRNLRNSKRVLHISKFTRGKVEFHPYVSDFGHMTNKSLTSPNHVDKRVKSR